MLHVFAIVQQQVLCHIKSKIKNKEYKKTNNWIYQIRQIFTVTPRPLNVYCVT